MEDKLKILLEKIETLTEEEAEAVLRLLREAVNPGD